MGSIDFLGTVETKIREWCMNDKMWSGEGALRRPGRRGRYQLFSKYQNRWWWVEKNRALHGFKTVVHNRG